MVRASGRFMGGGGDARVRTLFAAMMLLASLAAVLVSTKPTLALGGATLAAVIAISTRPRIAIALWLAVTCLVPFWLGTAPVFYLPPSTIIAVCLALGIVGARRRQIHAADWAVGIFLLLAGLVVVAGGGSQGSLAAMIFQWGFAYLVARTIAAAAGVQWTADWFAWLMVAVAALGIVEYLWQWHPFMDLVGQSSSVNGLAAIQSRGGMERSESTFGHAIAFGAALAAAIPFVMVMQRGRKWRFLALMVIFGGLLAAASRGPFLGAAFTIVLAVYALKKQITRGQRTAFILLFAVGVLTALPLVQSIQASAGLDLERSTDYRLSVFSQVAGDLTLFGLADYVRITEIGFFYRGFASVDNAFLASGLLYGAVVMAFMVAAVVIVVWRSLGRRATPPELALAGQLPLFLTVALISQYGIVIWFLLGLAVTWVQGQHEQAATGNGPARRWCRGRRSVEMRPGGAARPARTARRPGGRGDAGHELSRLGFSGGSELTRRR
ncbi:hypothetical protein [Blastococcus sp. SYSU DS0973]